MATNDPKVTAFPPQPDMFRSDPPLPDPGIDGVKMLKMLMAVAAVRVLALIAVLGGVGIWAWAAYDPHVLRLYAGGGFSIGVLLPIVWLYWKSGQG